MRTRSAGRRHGQREGGRLRAREIARNRESVRRSVRRCPDAEIGIRAGVRLSDRNARRRRRQRSGYRGRRRCAIVGQWNDEPRALPCFRRAVAIARIIGSQHAHGRNERGARQAGRHHRRVGHDDTGS